VDEDDRSSLEKLYNHITVKVTYHNLQEEILTFPERRPRVFNVMAATLKTWAADAIVQVAQRRHDRSVQFDWTRSLAFAAFGFLYVGVLQWILYVTLLTWMFPDAVIFANAPLSIKIHDRIGQLELLGQIFMDNCVITVLIYFPIFYIVKELVQGENSLPSRVHAGLCRYLKNILPDNITSVCLWVPLGFIVFAAPIWLRMPLEHCVSFVFTMIISTMRGAIEKPTQKTELPQGMIS
jgi:hypothetical protein